MPNRPRTGKIPPTLFRYLAREFIGPLLCCLVAFTSLFLVVDVLDVLQDLLEHDAPIRQVLLYFALRQPVNLAQELPMGILLAASYVTTRLSRHHEVTAVRAAGVSLTQAFTPLWAASLLLAVASFYLTERVVPTCNAKAKTLLDTLTSRRPSRPSARAALAFRNAVGDRDWFFEAFSLGGPQQGVLIKQFAAKERTLVWELRARHATFEDGRWVFTNGTVLTYDAGGALPEGPEEHFARRVEPSLTETPAEILNSLRPADELSTIQIRRLLSYHQSLPQSTRDVFRTTLWFRLAFPLSCVVAALLGVSLCATRGRSSSLLGFATAVGLMVLYHVTCQLFVLLGKTGAVPPVLGGALPTVVFIGWGCWAMHRRR